MLDVLLGLFTGNKENPALSTLGLPVSCRDDCDCNKKNPESPADVRDCLEVNPGRK